MPSTVVHAGFALLLAAALLRNAYDWKALAVILVVLVVPEIDTVMGFWMAGAHRTVLHNLTLPAAIAGLLYYDTRIRNTSVLRERWGDWGVRVAWVAAFAHVFAHALLDYAHLQGINALWPLHDSFYRLEGEIYVSLAEGFVQTFVDIDLRPAEPPEPRERRTRHETHVANPAQPEAAPDPDEPVDRRFPIAWHGWQLYLVATGLFTVFARRFQSDEADGD